MYINLSQNVTVKDSEIVGFFDIDNTTVSKKTRNFLNRAEKEKRIENISFDIPKTFIVTKKDKIYFSSLSSQTFEKRIKENI